MKRILTYMFPTLLAAAAVACFALRPDDPPRPPAPSAEDCAKKLAKVKQMREDLASRGIAAFVTNAALPKTAPHIHSQCWVDWLPAEETERRAYEQEKREFGLAFVGELEKCALRQRHLMDVNELERECNEMLRTVAWLKTSTGYGNYLLAHWAENLALNMIGKIAVYSETNQNAVNDLLARLTDFSSDFSFRFSVLNEEAPDRFWRPVTINPDFGYYTLMLQWGRRWKKALDHYKALGTPCATWRNARPDERTYVFYFDDPGNGEPPTTREMWNRKMHHAFCALAPDYYAPNGIRNIMRYRERVGPLPLPDAHELADPVAGKKYDESIDNQLPEDRVRKTQTKCAGSWIRSVCAGKFLDEWTRLYYQQVDRESKKALR